MSRTLLQVVVVYNTVKVSTMKMTAVLEQNKYINTILGLLSMWIDP
jgi:hypothetical protein